jgi:hypothetical protein
MVGQTAIVLLMYGAAVPRITAIGRCELTSEFWKSRSSGSSLPVFYALTAAVWTSGSGTGGLWGYGAAPRTG